ncbi:hypothetical protein GETHLI_13570 [Geothrix limicola]|uniref:DNA mismatch repair proteins mutS family domain-containing protein n=1 Tax=Geothrix limicola TaxID=2927978 RepID=A0ABQ5QEJ5_9BACT|nr:hypothetical protein [Geothrix limicola]GLH72855.1 hypothetical protein GETHLI_13570 [Geothrix limicola]
MTRAALAYAQFDQIWERFLPETPYGRAAKEAMALQTDAATLFRIWDETEAALALLEDLDAVRLSQLQHHLKRLPRICEEPRPRYDEVEIFQFKKFLHNYKGLVEGLGEEARATFGMTYASESLEQLLDRGRQSAESFYVADAYSADLARIRVEIREVDEVLQRLQAGRAAEIRERWGFEFGTKAFLLVPREALEPLSGARDLLRIEPFDDTKYAVRMETSAEAFLLLERRAALQSRERLAEDAVLERISESLRSELDRFEHYKEALTRFDLAFARARLAREHRLVRPTLGAGALVLKAGRFLPCEEACRTLGTDYVPLDARFEDSATVIFGSNMGGKTVALKTLAFLQFCTQMGLFVPAEAFCTRLFQHLHYLGEGQADRPARGLSGFGFEIRSFVEAMADFDRPTLVLFDEFARTTNSLEAEAILSAVLEHIASRPGVVALFSTHFRGVRRLSGVSYLRMKGLNREGLDLDLASGQALEARIRLIDQRMEFHLVPDEGGPGASDAITVAGLLGLDASIAQRATDFLHIDPRAIQE